MSKAKDAIVTRMGDGQRISMPVQEVEKELAGDLAIFDKLQEAANTKGPYYVHDV